MAKNILVVLVSLCVTSILSSVAGIAPVGGKDAPKISFVATRGKRDTSYFKNENNGRTRETTSILESTVQPSLDRLIEKETNDHPDNNNVYLRNLPELSIFKRTPAGFMGMRGKKDFEYSDYSPVDETMNLDPDGTKIKRYFLQGINRDLLYNGMIPKRAPSGFVGMRGKKSFDDIKRIPTSGFYGVRGKKSYLDSADIYDQLENYLQSESSFYDEYHPEYDWNTVDGQVKRTTKQGFYGMRGRRYGYPLNEIHNDNEKRAPTGFMGMRGRRFTDDNFDYSKRQPSGFYGVRGKKYESNQIQDERQLEKRAAFAQFFGTRGKKQPSINTGFFGMRGKKQPYEFRGKFVGVRGKKDDQSSTLQRLESQLALPDGEQNKRAPNGFLGMRGKKGSESD